MRKQIFEQAERESEYLADWEDKEIYKRGFIDGAKWQQKRMYSEEEVLRIITSCKEYLSFGDEFNEKEWFEQFKKK